MYKSLMNKYFSGGAAGTECSPVYSKRNKGYLQGVLTHSEEIIFHEAHVFYFREKENMGLFDKVFNTASAQLNYTPRNEQEAMVGIMYACMAVDGDVSEVEIDKLSNLVVFKSSFSGHPFVEYYKTALLLHKQTGSKLIIDGGVNKVTEVNKPMLFAMIMELLLSDGILADKEREIIDYVSTALKLNSDLAERIVEVILIKNKDNVPIVG